MLSLFVCLLLTVFKLGAQESKSVKHQFFTNSVKNDSTIVDDEGGIDNDPFEYLRFSPILPDSTLPIKPTRTISFTTHEGTDMNVDISPNGKTLVFDLLGDLYTIPSTGGNAKQLTTGMAINDRPIWSPDGKMIAYVSDYSGSFHLNVRDINGIYHQVFGKADKQVNDEPLWWPDGKSVQIDDYDYSIMGNSNSIKIHHPIGFSKDGRLFFYINSDSAALYSYDANNNTQTKISSVPKHLGNPKLSPDLHWFAFITDSGSKRCLVIEDMASKREHILVPSLILTAPVNNLVGFLNLQYCFSPDSKNIFIGYGGKIHRIEVLNGKDAIIPFTANVKVDLGAINYNSFRVPNNPVKVNYIRSAVASPDGKQVVFSALDQLYIMTLPNGKPHLLAPQPINQFQPCWSPDGKYIAYVSWCDTIGGNLWQVLANGGNPKVLSRVSGQYQRPVWSPDGKQIAVIKGGPTNVNDSLYSSGKGIPSLGDEYASFDCGIGQLQIISLDGSLTKAIVDSIPLWNQLVFSADGHQIMYMPKLKEGLDDLVPLLVSKNLQEKGQSVIAFGRITGGLDPADIKQRTLSPNGRFIVYSLGEDLYLVPQNSSKVPTIIYDEKKSFSAIRFTRGVDPHWENGGNILSWNYGNRFYRINPDKIVAAVEKHKTVKLKDSTFVKIEVQPDQIIPLIITNSSYHAQGQLAIRNVRIITMQGNKIIPHGTILINNGRFIAVGSTNKVHIPQGIKIIELPGKTIVPGFVDLHLHMHVPSDIFPQQSWMYMINLAYGVTTARDPRTNIDEFGYKELLESGQMIGPRLYPSGQAVDNGGDIGDMPMPNNLESIRSIVQKRKELGGTFIKQYGLPTRLQREWLLLASHENSMNMTNEGDFTPLADIGMLKDGSSGLEHNPMWDDVYKDVITLFAKSGTYFTPTNQVQKGLGNFGLNYFNYKYWCQPPEKLVHFTSDRQLGYVLYEKSHHGDTLHPDFMHLTRIDAKIRKASGRVTLGSHGDNQGVGVHNELWALQMGGLTNMQALQAATIMGAKALGIQKEVGSIEPGKIADLIVLNKNPLDDIHNSREIRYVMKDGILYNADNLDEIWPVYKKCPEWKLHTKTSINKPIKLTP
jgi:Tol biopolymer transport system component